MIPLFVPSLLTHRLFELQMTQMNGHCSSLRFCRRFHLPKCQTRNFTSHFNLVFLPLNIGFLGRPKFRVSHFQNFLQLFVTIDPTWQILLEDKITEVSMSLESTLTRIHRRKYSKLKFGFIPKTHLLEFKEFVRLGDFQLSAQLQLQLELEVKVELQLDE